jgi:hypothetical protein
MEITVSQNEEETREENYYWLRPLHQQHFLSNRREIQAAVL